MQCRFLRARRAADRLLVARALALALALTLGITHLPSPARAGGAAPAASAASGPAPAPLAQRIPRVENGLLPPPFLGAAPATPAPMRLPDRMAHYGVSGVAIAVIHRGRVEWARGYGVLRAGGSQAVDPLTLFHGCSLSKVINAVALMKLAQEGKLDFDRDINSQLKTWKLPPTLFTDQNPVTLRRILSHTAGFGSPFATGYDLGKPAPTAAQILDGLPPAGTPPVRLQARPGEEYYYSGGGVTVSQQLLMDVVGEPYEQATEALVFRPLGMSRTTFRQDLPADWAARAAAGHNDEKMVVNGPHRAYPALAAAGVWSTAADLAELVIEIQGSAPDHPRRVLSEASVAQMLKPQARADALAEVGLGLFLTGEGEARRFYHAGVHAGYWALLLGYDPAGPYRGEGVVILTNSDTGGFLVAEILRGIAREYGWPGYDKPLPISSTHP